MPIVDVDVTTAGLIPDGTYNASISDLKYQTKVGEKWNADGTATVSFDEWVRASNDTKRLHYTLRIEGKGNLWQDLYMKDSARGFIKQIFDACGVAVTKEGFDPEAIVGKSLLITVAIRSENGYDSNIITKMTKV